MTSIRAQLGIVFVMVLLPLVVTAGAIVAVSRVAVAGSREIFDVSLRLEEIDRGLIDADQHLRTYLDVRTLESLRGYYETVDRLERNAAALPTMATLGERDLSLVLVRRLIHRYIDSTAEVVAAGRGRLVAEYTSLYRESVRLRELTSLLVSTLYWQDVGSNVERFTRVSGVLNRLVFESGIALAVIAAVALLSIGVLSQRIATPIAELSRRAHAVADGAFDLPDFGPQRVAREIADLGASFDVMKRSIKRSIDEINRNADVERRLMEQDIAVLRMRSSLRSAQLLALQSRINPHFLYNTLNTGVQLAVVEGAERTTEYLERFGTAVRGLLADPSTPVTVAAEFESLEHYLYIMRIRFGDRIEFVTRVDDTVRDVLIPPLILQPLVENSITHGLRDTERHGYVEASAKHDGEHLTISVSDNGRGMAADRVRAITRDPDRGERDPEVQADSGAHHDGTGERGIGVANVIERLELSFGRRDICTIRSAPDHGTTVTFSLPLRLPAGDPTPKVAHDE